MRVACCRVRWLALVAATLALVMGAAPAALASTGSEGRTSAVIEAIDRHVAVGIEENAVPGGAVAVVLPDGRAHVRGFGTTGYDGEPVTPRTPFLIGSVTKSFTALAVVQAAERGLVDLDEPVSAYLSWFAVEPAADTPRVTVRMLLQHTSGLGALAGGPADAWQQEATIDDTARRVAGSRLQHPPGTAFEYANANYVLLGALLEAVTGHTYAEVVDRQILTPLGMTRTFVDLADARAAGMAEGHRYWFGRPVRHLVRPQGLVPAGLLISTAEDMGRYLQMLLGEGERDGVRVVSEGGFRVLTTPGAPARLGPWAKRPDAFYAAGWYVGEGPFGPRDVVFHPGASPDFGAMTAFSPQQGSGIAVLVNVGPRTNLPGAVGAVDRIGAGAVSLVLGSEPATGGTMRTAYLRADLVLAAVVALLLLLLAGSFRRPVRPPSRRLPRTRRVARVLVPLTLALGVLSLPALLGGGWRQSWLWVPDLTLAAATVGCLLLALSAANLRQRSTAPVRQPRARHRDARVSVRS